MPKKSSEQYRHPSPPCVYCGKSSSTVDHVFPRSLFGERRIERAVKVRACFDCNQAKGILDTIMRDWTAVDLRYNAHPVAKANMFGPVVRSFDRRQTPLRHTITGISETDIDLVTEAGIILHQATPVSMRGDEVREWLRFVVQGLSYHHYNTRIPQNFPHLTMQPDAKIFRAQIESVARHREFAGPFMLGDNVVQWAYIGLGPLHTLWLIILYGRLNFTVAVLPPDQLEVLRRRAEEVVDSPSNSLVP